MPSNTEQDLARIRERGRQREEARQLTRRLEALQEEAERRRAREEDRLARLEDEAAQAEHDARVFGQIDYNSILAVTLPQTKKLSKKQLAAAKAKAEAQTAHAVAEVKKLTKLSLMQRAKIVAMLEGPEPKSEEITYTHNTTWAEPSPGIGDIMFVGTPTSTRGPSLTMEVLEQSLATLRGRFG